MSEKTGCINMMRCITLLCLAVSVTGCRLPERRLSDLRRGIGWQDSDTVPANWRFIGIDDRGEAGTNRLLFSDSTGELHAVFTRDAEGNTTCYSPCRIFYK